MARHQPSGNGRSRHVDIVVQESVSALAIDWPRTILAKGRAPLARHHLRARRTRPMPVRSYFFLLDCSASMIDQRALARAKGLLLVWLRAVRRQTEQAALICYGGAQADVRFGPAIPSGWNERWIDPIGGGGGTPLALGVQLASQLAVGQMGVRKRDTTLVDTQKILLVLTDGRTREAPPRPEGFRHIVIVDFESQIPALHRCALLAEQWGAQYLHVTDLASA
jgi:magnesium chelatase subunit ChlD-like protein